MSADMRHFLLLPTLLFPATQLGEIGCLRFPSKNSLTFGSLLAETHSEIVLYHNLGLEDGPNFRWQYNS